MADDEHQPQTDPAQDSAAGDGTPPDQGGADSDSAENPFELVEVEWRGARWQIPKDRGLWDMNVQFEFEEGNRIRGLLTLLGGSPDNIAKARREVYAVARTNREVDEFMDHVTNVLNKECTG